MSLKTILVAASGGTASDGAVETACRLAERFSAHVEGFHVRIDASQVIALASDGFGMPAAGDWIDRMTEDTETLAKKTKAGFLAATARHGIATSNAAGAKATVDWREETGYAPDLVARRARFFDLVVLGRSERVVQRPHSDTIEETLIHSGRPVLLAPAKPAAIGESIALGWNGSAEAVHVLIAALPLLAAAKTVTVITVSSEPDSAKELVGYLARQGVKATHSNVLPVHGAGPGQQLLSQAREAGADLLVMGAFGHRPWREILFGGATQQVMDVSLLPVLLAH
jgi:nucleotide-binding universal stress UspA family protein